MSNCRATCRTCNISRARAKKGLAFGACAGRPVLIPSGNPWKKAAHYCRNEPSLGKVESSLGLDFYPGRITRLAEEFYRISGRTTIHHRHLQPGSPIATATHALFGRSNSSSNDPLTCRSPQTHAGHNFHRLATSMPSASVPTLASMAYPSLSRRLHSA